MQFCCCNLSPRGDGNLLHIAQKFPLFCCNLSPRGDGNAQLVIEGDKAAAVAIYPREGTETPVGHYHQKGVYRCNLSPRGDGNRNGDNLHFVALVAIYPREGTETKRSFSAFILLRLQFIPARGRKHRCSFMKSVLKGCNLSPRGDGNWMSLRTCKMFWVAIYPREGTETMSSPSRFSSRICCNLSPRGDGNSRKYRAKWASHALQFIPARGRKRASWEAIYSMVSVAIYPREGTETITSITPAFV